MHEFTRKCLSLCAVEQGSAQRYRFDIRPRCMVLAFVSSSPQDEPIDPVVSGRGVRPENHARRAPMGRRKPASGLRGEDESRRLM